MTHYTLEELLMASFNIENFGIFVFLQILLFQVGSRRLLFMLAHGWKDSSLLPTATTIYRAIRSPHLTHFLITTSHHKKLGSEAEEDEFSEVEEDNFLWHVCRVSLCWLAFSLSVDSSWPSSLSHCLTEFRKAVLKDSFDQALGTITEILGIFSQVQTTLCWPVLTAGQICSSWPNFRDF